MNAAFNKYLRFIVQNKSDINSSFVDVQFEHENLQFVGSCDPIFFGE